MGLWAPPDPHLTPQAARSGAAHEDHGAAGPDCGGLQEEVTLKGAIKAFGPMAASVTAP